MGAIASCDRDALHRTNAMGRIIASCVAMLQRVGGVNELEEGARFRSHGRIFPRRYYTHHIDHPNRAPPIGMTPADVTPRDQSPVPPAPPVAIIPPAGGPAPALREQGNGNSSGVSPATKGAQLPTLGAPGAGLSRGNRLQIPPHLRGAGGRRGSAARGYPQAPPSPTPASVPHTVGTCLGVDRGPVTRPPRTQKGSTAIFKTGRPRPISPVRHTKIVATVGPATRSEEALTRMVRAAQKTSFGLKSPLAARPFPKTARNQFLSMVGILGLDSHGSATILDLFCISWVFGPDLLSKTLTPSTILIFLQQLATGLCPLEPQGDSILGVPSF